MQDSNVDWCFTGGAPDEGFFGNFIEVNHLVPDKDSDAGDSTSFANNFQENQSCVPLDSNTFQPPPARELNSQERDSALSRYKEKKKTRR